MVEHRDQPLKHLAERRRLAGEEGLDALPRPAPCLAGLSLDGEQHPEFPQDVLVGVRGPAERGGQGTDEPAPFPVEDDDVRRTLPRRPRRVERDDPSVLPPLLPHRLLVVERDDGVGDAVVEVERPDEAVGRHLPTDLGRERLQRRTIRLVDEALQGRLAVPHEVVVDPHLRAVAERRQVDIAGCAALAPDVLGEPLQRLAHRRLGHDVAVEDDGDVPPAVERDVVPLGQEGDPAVGILALEAPDARERDGAEAVGGEGIALLDALSDRERRRRVSKGATAARRHVQLEGRAERIDVLERLVVPLLRLVGAIDVTARLAVGAEGRDEDARPGPLALLEPHAQDGVLAEGGAVAPLADHLVREAAALPQMCVMRRQQIGDGGGEGGGRARGLTTHRHRS